jgi:hypothetical protein
MNHLPSWLLSILADPVTKQAVAANHFPLREGVLDARVFLKHTHGYDGWAEGQTAYEQFGLSDTTDSAGYGREIAGVRPVYEHYPMRGRILDCGGGLAPCGSSWLQMWSSYPPIRGWPHPSPAVRRASRPTGA